MCEKTCPEVPSHLVCLFVLGWLCIYCFMIRMVYRDQVRSIYLAALLVFCVAVGVVIGSSLAAAEVSDLSGKPKHSCACGH